MVDEKDGIRQCGQCEEWLPAGEFKKNQKGYFFSACRECANRVARERYRAKQAQAGKVPRRVVPEDRDGRRMCRDCEEWLPLEDFSPTKHQRSGRASYCRPCMNRRSHDRVVAKAAAEGREVRAVRTRGPEDRDGFRMCRDCDVWQPLAKFAPSSTRESGHGSYCQACMNERSKTSYAKQIFKKFGREVRKPEILPEGQKRCARCSEVKELAEFVKATRTVTGTHSYCKPCFNEAVKKSRASHHGSSRNFHLKRRYNLTEEQVEIMLDEQGGVCAICNVEHESYHVDHDHVTGRVRGILCFKCNNALGLFQDDRDRLQAALDYLAETPGADEHAILVPDAHRDPKGTWARRLAEIEANREHQVRRLHSIFGVPARDVGDVDRRVTGRGSP